MLYKASGLMTKLISIGVLPLSTEPVRDWLTYTSFELDDDASLGEWVEVSREEELEIQRILDKHRD